MDADVQAIMAFVNTMDVVKNTGELIDQFGALVQFLGFEYFVITGLPHEGRHFRNLIAGHNFPIRWAERYQERGYLQHDAIAQAAAGSLMPFYWRDAIALFATTERSKQIARESAEFGLVDGIGFPYLAPNNRKAIASIATGSSVTLDGRVLLILNGLMPRVYQRYWELAIEHNGPGRPLTKNEIAALQLLSAGYSVEGAAGALNTSFITMRRRIDSAREKLGTKSIAQTVASAIRSGQL